MEANIWQNESQMQMQLLPRLCLPASLLTGLQYGRDGFGGTATIFIFMIAKFAPGDWKISPQMHRNTHPASKNAHGTKKLNLEGKKRSSRSLFLLNLKYSKRCLKHGACMSELRVGVLDVSSLLSISCRL